MTEEDKRAAAVPASIPGEDEPPPHQHEIEHVEGAEAASSNMSGLGTIDYPHHSLRSPPPASPVLRHDNDEYDETQNLAATLQRTLRVERSEAEETPQQHELSPGLLNSLRGSSSPSYSQVSVGSVGPTTMLPPTKPCDLTPVTRNTSGEYHAPVTPGGTDFLHGEHLALPADLNETSSSSSGPSMPPLKIMSSHLHHQPPPPPAPIIASGLPPHGNEEIPEHTNRLVQFPPRKYYSFTTREQYEQAMLQGEAYDLSDDDDDDDEDKLTPYAPVARPADFDIESLPDEELQQIFADRHQSSSEDNSESNCKAPHRLLAAPIPLEGRIPSLHLANRLMGDSTHSLASTTSLASVNDNDSHNLTEDEDSVVQLVLDHTDNDDSFWNTNSSHSYDDSGDGGAAGDTTTNPPTAAAGHAGEEDVVRRHLLRKRKQLLKETQAVEWLQSLDSSQVAEAASSKFLLTKQPAQQQQKGTPPAAVPLKRITSTPVGRP